MNLYGIYGIDLGSYNSTISTFSQGALRPIVIEEDRSTVNSSITYFEENTFVCGIESARIKEQYIYSTIDFNKRIKGKSYDEVKDYTDIYVEREQDYDGQVYYKLNCNGNTFYKTPIQVDIDFMSWLLSKAEELTGVRCEYLIVTYPAFFTDRQRDATLLAAKSIRPDITVLPLLPEPISAAIATNLMPVLDTRFVVVYDFGGGTFDVAIMKETLGDYEVIATYGNTNLGGIDITNYLTNYILSIVQNNYPATAKLGDPVAVTQLRNECETAKLELTTADYVTIPLTMFDIENEIPLTIDDFNNLISGFIKATIQCCIIALQAAKINLSEKDRFILVGGSSHLRCIRQHLEDTFHIPVLNNVNAYNIVSLGAVRTGVSRYCEDRGIPSPLNTYNIHLMVLRDYGICLDGKEVTPILRIGDRANEKKEVVLHNNLFKPKITVYYRNSASSNWEEMGSFRLVSFFNTKIYLYMNNDGTIWYEYKSLKSTYKQQINSPNVISRAEAMLEMKRVLYAKNCAESLSNNIPAIQQHPDEKKRSVFLGTITNAVEFFHSNDVIHIDVQQLGDFYNSVVTYITNNW